MGLVAAGLFMTGVVFVTHYLSEPMEKIAVRNGLKNTDWGMLFMFYWLFMSLGLLGLEKFNI